MKVGVLTYASAVDNYGQVLQYLATQDYLRELGHEPYLVLARNCRMTFGWRLLNKALRILKKMRHHWQVERMEMDSRKSAAFNKWSEISSRNEIRHPRHFHEFRERHFSMISGTYPEILRQGFDAFCVGSDQTWSGVGEHYLLSWTPKKCKRFTIAPSIGNRIYDNYDCWSFRRAMRRFDFVTVREGNALDFCRRCGRSDAIQILDPVFLQLSEAYEKYRVEVKAERPYVFVYMLGGEISVSVRKMIAFCKEKGFDVKYVESQGREEDEEKIYATVEQWLGLISGAAYVLTNSFHGMAFSVIFKVPFLVFPLTGFLEGQNVRVEDLARKMGFENRICKDGDLARLFNGVDWSTADCAVQRNKEVLNGLMSRLTGVF